MNLENKKTIWQPIGANATNHTPSKTLNTYVHLRSATSYHGSLEYPAPKLPSALLEEKGDAVSEKKKIFEWTNIRNGLIVAKQLDSSSSLKPAKSYRSQSPFISAFFSLLLLHTHTFPPLRHDKSDEFTTADLHKKKHKIYFVSIKMPLSMFLFICLLIWDDYSFHFLKTDCHGFL